MEKHSIGLKTIQERYPVAIAGDSCCAVSVIIPCYNYDRFLEEAVESVLAQTFDDFEIIIVDDGSSDRSVSVARELIDKYRHHRIQLLVQERAGQPAYGRNLGIYHSKGRYILPLDADDVLLPTMLEETVALLEGSPELHIAYTHVLQFKTDPGKGVEVRAVDFDPQLLPLMNHLSYCSLFRREVWEDVGGYRTNLPGVEDWDFWVAATACGYVGKRIAKPLFGYRKHGGGLYKDTESKMRQRTAQLVLNNSSLFTVEDLVKARKILLGIPVGARTPLLKKPPQAAAVSVILPTWNRLDLLRQAIESVQNQTFEDWELIVVNDCGEEISPLVESLRRDGDRITTVSHSENRGISAARNTGLKLARGKWIAYLDDDDRFHRNHLETLVNALKKENAKVAFSQCRRVYYKDHGNGYESVRSDYPYRFSFDPQYYLVQSTIPVIALVHERACLDEAGFFDEGLTAHEDWDFFIRLSLHYSFCQVGVNTVDIGVYQGVTNLCSENAGDLRRTAKIIMDRYRFYLDQGHEAARYWHQRYSSLVEFYRSYPEWEDSLLSRP